MGGALARMAARLNVPVAAALLLAVAAASAPAQHTGPVPIEHGAPWRFVGLPALPPTRIEPVELDGERVLRVRSEAGYGQWVLDFAPPVPAPARLEWEWRLERRNERADLRRRDADDTSLKVCALFAMPDDRVPFAERLLLKLARSRSAEPLPAATLCYVWDARLPAGTLLPNAYSARVRYLVAEGEGAPLAAWRVQRRDLAADFLRAFGDESREVPPLQALAVGADADNTGAASLGHLRGLRWGR
jgi:hypothetical protein